MSALRALVMLPVVLVLACTPGGGEPATDAGAGQPVAEQPDAVNEDPATSESVVVEPAADLEGECEDQPRTKESGNPELTAELRVVNTGNVGVRVRVAAFWPQPGRRGISQYQRLALEQGESKDVNLRLEVGQQEARGIRRALDDGRTCRVRLRVTGAFGTPDG